MIQFKRKRLSLLRATKRTSSTEIPTDSMSACFIACEQALLAGLGRNFGQRKNMSLMRSGRRGDSIPPCSRFASATYFFFTQTFSPNPQGEPARRLLVLELHLTDVTLVVQQLKSKCRAFTKISFWGTFNGNISSSYATLQAEAGVNSNACRTGLNYDNTTDQLIYVVSCILLLLQLYSVIRTSNFWAEVECS